MKSSIAKGRSLFPVWSTDTRIFTRRWPPACPLRRKHLATFTKSCSTFGGGWTVAHDKASVRASGQVGALAALRCGTTTLIDHHASPSFIDGSLSALRDGIAEIGCRGVLCYEVTDRNGLEGAKLGLRENERFIDECRAESQHRFAGIVGAHASFTLGDNSLAACVALCRDKSAGLHIHVAEDPVDERMTREQSGCGSDRALSAPRGHGFAGNDFRPRHAFKQRWHRSRRSASGNITLAHNPSSNMNNGVGYTPVIEHRKPPVLGTDGIGADMWREARTALFKSNDAGLALP